MRQYFITLLTKKSPRQTAFWLLLANLPLLWLLPVGCGLPAGAPLIRDFTFTGQVTADPRQFCFSLEWRDQEGDLTSAENPGQIRLTFQDLSNPSQQPQSLAPYKIGVTAVPPGTQSGIFPDICINFREQTGSWPNQIKITAQLVDSEGNLSNKAWVIVEKKQTP